MAVTIGKQSIRFTDGKIIDLIYPIDESLVTQTSVVALLKSPITATLNRNVFLYNHEGDLVWQIESLSDYHKNKNQAPYTGAMHIVNKNLKVYNWDGFQVTIDITSGKILETLFTK